MKKIILILGIIMFCFVFSTRVYAVEISGATFNNSYREGDVYMPLQGTGLKTKFFIKAFAAGFYKSEGVGSNALGEYPKRIEVEYFVTISAQKMNDFTVKSMQDNVSQGEFYQITDQLSLMSQYFVNLKPGDRYSLTFIPGVGTKFAHNNQLVGTIPGELFAKALFSTWLGEKPFDSNLKKEILGSANKQGA